MKKLSTIIALTCLSLSPSLFTPAVAKADFSDGHHDRWDHGNDYRNNRDYNSGDYWYGPRYDRQAGGVIGQGVRDGRLTPDEVRELDRDKGRVQRDEARARSDGYVSQGERDQIRRDQGQFQHDLNHELHDGERR